MFSFMLNNFEALDIFIILGERRKSSSHAAHVTVTESKLAQITPLNDSRRSRLLPNKQDSPHID